MINNAGVPHWVPLHRLWYLRRIEKNHFYYFIYLNVVNSFHDPHTIISFDLLPRRVLRRTTKIKLKEEVLLFFLMRKVYQKHNKDSFCSSENTRIYEYAKKLTDARFSPMWFHWKVPFWVLFAYWRMWNQLSNFKLVCTELYAQTCKWQNLTVRRKLSVQ